MEIDDDPVFVHPPSQNLFCPICHELYKNPVVTRECGHSFCEVCIFQIESSLCPLCRRKINLGDIHQNLVLDQLAKEIPVYCRYRKSGCHETFPIVSKAIHEKQCKFGPSRCPHIIRGCRFEGTKLQLEEHLKSRCPFELMSDYIMKLEQQMHAMKQQIEKQSLEIKDLKRKHIEVTEHSRATEIPRAEEPSSPQNSVAASDGDNTRRSSSPSLSDKDKWDILGMQCKQTLAGHNRGVTTVIYNEKSGYIFSGSHDNTVRVWSNRTATGETVQDYTCIKVLEGHKYTVWSLAVSNDGKRLFSGSNDASIICWNIDTFERVQAFTETTGKVYILELVGKFLYSAGSDRKIKVWETDTLQLVKVMEGHTGPIWKLVAVGPRLYSCSDDKTIRIWNLETYECIQTIEQVNSPTKILSLAISSNYILAGTDDCKIKVWDAATYEYKTTLTDHSWEVWQLCTNSDLLFSGSYDHTIKVWDLDDFKCLKTLTGHKGFLHSVNIGPSYHLLSGSGDKTIKIWRGFGNIL